MLAGVMTVTDMPSVADGVVYVVRVWCLIVTDVL